MSDPIANPEALLAGLHLMFDEAPRDWWKFVPCKDCMSNRQEPCVKGGAAWPEPARQPHASRVRAARVLHGTLWLLANGFEPDVLGRADLMGSRTS